jgi:hypothetical protein
VGESGARGMARVIAVEDVRYTPAVAVLEVVDEAGGRRLEAGYLQQLRDVTGLGCGGAEFVAAVAAYASGG